MRTATTLSERYARAIEHEERTADYLAALEETIDDNAKVARWQCKVDKWIEKVLHREEEVALDESPYEIGQQFKKSTLSVSLHSMLADALAGMTDKELLTKITQGRSASSQSAIGLLSVIQDGLRLQQER